MITVINLVIVVSISFILGLSYGRSIQWARDNTTIEDITKRWDAAIKEAEAFKKNME